jgi:hypothetical protein
MIFFRNSNALRYWVNESETDNTEAHNTIFRTKKNLSPTGKKG